MSIAHTIEMVQIVPKFATLYVKRCINFGLERDEMHQKSSNSTCDDLLPAQTNMFVETQTIVTPTAA